MTGLLDRTPPAWVRKLEAMALMRTFADAFSVEAPSLGGLPADEALWTFREFTAACMEMTRDGEPLADILRGRLGKGALELGRKARALVPARLASAPRLARYLYRGIGIELQAELPGGVRFGPCLFAGRYTPRDCWFMSAFDEGFLRGLSGEAGADLDFSCRLTQGSPCCMARFEKTKDRWEA